MKNFRVQCNEQQRHRIKNTEQVGCPEGFDALIPNPHLCSFLFSFSSNYMRIKDINNSTYNNNNDKNDDDDDDDDDDDKDKDKDEDEDKGKGKGKGKDKDKVNRLRAVSCFSLQSYCTRNLSTPAAKPRTARNEGVSPRGKK